MSEQNGTRYSTVLIDKEGLELLREAKLKLVNKGIGNLDPPFRDRMMKQVGPDKLEAFSRGTLVIIALLALIYLIDKE